ncbi:ER-Golgi trafficking TRAPP I complex 85 kDa subunit [Hirsutella rhossiliensis]|uniref:ER-Golgi trafficking TRAPP I complex 85 kDa subunit domain-containing protein n=1 Tax=Hirsutella rhossiliensis TaxID=111463 RepID=A0A9P8MW75_9HYPO|nr:ER-Golgi trafficking TRAPP I complex 85 kDa subunit domain-containing protein [Hirsutella rhossiliensis]KAH0960297.1 ER-Golgi trafficking TRAPP I complex 85 kDa subunit domain-containing protein [Hirsutella rhossiliensis]
MPLPVQDESPTEPIQALPAVAAALKPSKSRHSTPAVESLLMSQSEPNLTFRRSNPSAASLYASTLSPPGSRPMSPAGRGLPPRVFSGGVFDASPNHASSSSSVGSPGEPANLLLHSFVPHVSIFASEDTESLMGEKGFRNGLWELLRPFGEDISGKVTVRDSNGVGRTFEDFSIRFTRFGENIGHPDPAVSGANPPQTPTSQNGAQESATRDRKLLADVEAVVELHLSYAERSFVGLPHQRGSLRQAQDSETASPYYTLYLRRLLSGFSMTPHETFAHPVACIIAISSRNETPIEELRRLYTETNQGQSKLPPWVDSEYLRYYVLVHDEENDDITRSMALFEQMKRHLGLHCHLLRLRCSQSAETDDDSIPLPRSNWMSAAEELTEIRRSDSMDEFEDPTRYIFESDATAIRTFVREMITQSIVPTMERHVSVWNDQVASRRRGITGRFMNLSRKWAGFGGSSRSSSGGNANSRDSYDASGFYRADSAEAIMRKLADYAFMLRDWKLAQSTYDLLRSDFSESKAWKYHAAANEMAAISLLLVPQSVMSKSRAETIDQMLESAFYSYGTRCSAPYGALRSLTLGHELLRLRGGSNIDDAGRWGLRLLESKMLGRVGDALLKERLAVCYASKGGIGNLGLGNRHRKSAAWSVLAADSWCRQAKYIPAQRCLEEAQREYSSLPHEQGVAGFASAGSYIKSLQQELEVKLHQTEDDAKDEADDEVEGVTDEESEALMDTRARRISVGAGAAMLETAPLHGSEPDKEAGAAPTGQAQEGFD